MEKTMKRMLSFLIAASIVLSGWLWIAPYKVEATQDMYTVTIDYEIMGGSWLGNGAPDNSVFVVSYITDNGNGSEMEETLQGGDLGGEEDIIGSLSLSVPGWPSKVSFEVDSEIFGVHHINIISIKINGKIVCSGLWVLKREGGFGSSIFIAEPDSRTNPEASNTSGTIISPNPSEKPVIWNWSRPGGKQFPAGYNFDEDSYSFGNFGDKSLSKKYFTSLFKSSNAEEIYKVTKKAGGLCCGFAYSTVAIYNNIPTVNSIYDKSLTGKITYANTLRDVSKSSKIDIGDKTISISDYIKYSYVYQLSEDVLQQRRNSRIYYGSNQNGIFELYNLVKSVTEDNNLYVVIWLNQIKDIVPDSDCHTVVCVGIEGNSILIDDSNLRQDHGYNDELARLRINDDGTWVYEPYNGKYNYQNTFIDYALDCHKPYSILLTGEKVLADDHWLENNDTGNSYVVGCEKLDEGRGILYCDAVNYELNDFEKTEFLDIGSGEDNSEYNGKLYWVDENEKISVTNIENSGKNSEFHFSSGDTISEVIISDGSSVTFDSDKSMEIDAEMNNEYTVSYAYCFEDENYKDNIVRISVSGVASDEVIEAKQTDNGIEVTGISDGTVTLTKDDEVIETQEIKDAVGEIEITYDKNGENEDVELEYHSHSYTSSITTPATHTAEGIETFTCSCGDSYTKTVAKLEDHTYTSTTVSPNCTTDGITTYTCACGDSYTVTVPATGHSHGDDGLCINCGEYNKAYDKTLSDSDNCSHLCHKSGFMGFIWMIVRIFIKLFKTNPICECGAAHY